MRGCKLFFSILWSGTALTAVGQSPGRQVARPRWRRRRVRLSLLLGRRVRCSARLLLLQHGSASSNHSPASLRRSHGVEKERYELSLWASPMEA